MGALGRSPALAAGLALALAAAPAGASWVGRTGPGAALTFPLKDGGSVVGVSYERALGPWRGASDTDPGFEETAELHALRLWFAFSPVRWLALAVHAPLNERLWSAQLPGYPPVTTQQLGIGDLQVSAQAFLWQSESEALAVGLGAVAPTGQNAFSADGYRLAEHAQLGTGAAIPFADLRFTSRGDPLWAWVGGSFWLPLENRFRYQYGPEVRLWVASGLRLWPDILQRVGMELSWNGMDVLEGEAFRNTGGVVVWLVPAMEAKLLGWLRLEGAVRLPLAPAMNGVQRLGATVQIAVEATLE